VKPGTGRPVFSCDFVVRVSGQPSACWCLTCHVVKLAACSRVGS
jgi:hypothetical protein